MTAPNKFQQRMDDLIAQASTSVQVASEQTFTIIADATRALKRAQKRAEVPAGFERIEIVQQRGPTVEMSARLIADARFETKTRDPMLVVFEVYETAGGALVAVKETEPADRAGHAVVTATVVERQDDAQAMRFAVMDAFDWHDRARNMAKKLGWSLKVEVE